MFIQTAQANTTEEGNIKEEKVGEVFIYLTGVSTEKPFPDKASLVIRDAYSKSIVSYEAINNDVIVVDKPFGSYFLEFNIPGYERMQAKLDISEDLPIANYSLGLNESNIPIGAQMLFSLTETKLDFREFDTYKRIGVHFARQGDFSTAVRYYDKALKITPTETQVIDYKGYSLYRNGEFNEALLTFDKALRTNADYTSSKLNKIKVLCALTNRDKEAKSLIDTADNKLQALLRSDKEIRKVCPKNVMGKR